MDTHKTIFFHNHDSSLYLQYQHYYLLGLERHLANASSITGMARQGAFARLLDSFERARHKQMRERFSGHDNDHVGQYLMRSPGKGEVKFAIDAHDHRDIRSPEVQGWADVYFKSNMWPSIQYPPNVHPIINGNGILTHDKLRHLKKLRNSEKEYDVAFIARVWGGQEHNIRLFEQIAKVRGNNKLLAIFTPWNKDQPTLPGFVERLSKSRVEHTFELMQETDLWQIMAKSKIVIMRAGKHLCIPWRMIDALCMGCCLVLDSNPYPAWPVPLREGENYSSLGIQRPVNTDPAHPCEYEAIPDSISKVLADPDLRERIAAANSAYFDTHAAPGQVGAYITGTIEKLYA